MLSIISVIVSIIDIIITIFGVVIPFYVERKNQMPELMLYAPKTGMKPSDEDYIGKITQINGYYKMQRDFDNQLQIFLQQNNEQIDFSTQHFMELIFKAYRDKTYNEGSSYYPTKEVNYIVNKFKENKKFLEILNKYKIYYNYSKWILDLENVGESSAYDLQIDMFKESNSGAMIYNGTLKKDEKRSIMIYYFDNALILENDCNAIWKENITTNFIIIDKKRFNDQKYERLFNITYKDKYGKTHDKYCCAYVGKNEKVNLMGVK